MLLQYSSSGGDVTMFACRSLSPSSLPFLLSQSFLALSLARSLSILSFSIFVTAMEYDDL